jgi:hypothetical protein
MKGIRYFLTLIFGVLLLAFGAWFVYMRFPDSPATAGASPASNPTIAKAPIVAAVDSTVAHSAESVGATDSMPATVAVAAPGSREVRNTGSREVRPSARADTGARTPRNTGDVVARTADPAAATDSAAAPKVVPPEPVTSDPDPTRLQPAMPCC